MSLLSYLTVIMRNPRALARVRDSEISETYLANKTTIWQVARCLSDTNDMTAPLFTSPPLRDFYQRVLNQGRFLDSGEEWTFETLGTMKNHEPRFPYNSKITWNSYFFLLWLLLLFKLYRMNPPGSEDVKAEVTRSCWKPNTGREPWKLRCYVITMVLVFFFFRSQAM